MLVTAIMYGPDVGLDSTGPVRGVPVPNGPEPAHKSVRLVVAPAVPRGEEGDVTAGPLSQVVASGQGFASSSG